MVTLDELCLELKNWFCKYQAHGEFIIEDGSIDLSGLVKEGILQEGQYIRIVGSTFNDGVYVYPTEDLVAEVFDGAVWLMAVPPAVISLLDEINAWLDKYGDILQSPLQSESFGGYSYSKGLSVSSGIISSWQDQFKSRLHKWRKIRA